MKIEIWSLGQDSDTHIKQGENLYLKRISTFAQCELAVIKTSKIKSRDPKVIKLKEAELIITKLKKRNAYLILLDENGKQLKSREFAQLVERNAMLGNKDVIFLIGGSYGFDQKIYAMANEKIALSKLTFPHQLVRLIFVEQLYRAFAILNGLPYHHD